jgi:Ca2+-binding EF-hand superfamily protein
MASDFQRRKISGVFAAMDADDDGFLTKEDFAALTARWISLRSSGDEVRLAEIMMGWWKTLLAASERDARVTLNDVLVVVDRLGSMPDAVEGTALAMFEAIDEDGDGRISGAEYHRLIRAWNGQETDTDAVFPLLDRDGDGHISKGEFVGLWREFWAGDDPDDPGTWVFGRFELAGR